MLSPAPKDTGLSTAQAAEILGVSHPFFLKLLDSGKIPFRETGARRRVRMEDVVSYKEESDKRRKQVLAELTRESQEQGEYFNE
ncbi:MAG: helix-turn-helix domain-containing protein [Alphaproteobacteria bacterium]|nr:helix-turn-helix domain-containing protein [Alphaproteobacteria bacterium]MDA8000857.1 helix-turn-helix domain-containing protein [Alphaproteobacteria bacterium]MDA8004264.1 helix-turn-helix domain-containing protein [Alphaproteobacteria bacterium]MDA8006063.1 helix-turn-helix domain-containing protein [Alphaproteobacteria bacterium]